MCGHGFDRKTGKENPDMESKPCFTGGSIPVTYSLFNSAVWLNMMLVSVSLVQNGLYNASWGRCIQERTEYFSLWSDTDHRRRRTDVGCRAFNSYNCIWGQETTPKYTVLILFGLSAKVCAFTVRLDVLLQEQTLPGVLIFHLEMCVIKSHRPPGFGPEWLFLLVFALSCIPKLFQNSSIKVNDL